MSDDEKRSAEAGHAAAATPEQPPEDAADAAMTDIETLQQALDEARNAAAAAREDVLRARAEADNIRKRAERDVAAAHKFGLERFVGNLLPIVDSMDLGYAALETTTDIDAIREGMVLTRKMLDDALEKAGVSVVDPVGETFNPEFHQAMTMQPSSEAAPGTVLTVMQKGYLLNERLVRPAMVVVAKALEENEP